RMESPGTQVAAHTVPQRARFPDVDRFSGPVREQVHSGLLGQAGDLGLEILDGHKLLWRALQRVVEPFIIIHPFMTFTGSVGKACMFPLRAIIKASVALG